jgi:FMN phosphatase YigB (HAD superfamily)
VVKPEPRLFELACGLLAVSPGQALMVGDDPTTDGGAVRVGIATLILPPARPGMRRGLDRVLRLVQPPTV